MVGLPRRAFHSGEFTLRNSPLTVGPPFPNTGSRIGYKQYHAGSRPEGPVHALRGRVPVSASFLALAVGKWCAATGAPRTPELHFSCFSSTLKVRGRAELSHETSPDVSGRPVGPGGDYPLNNIVASSLVPQEIWLDRATSHVSCGAAV